MPRPGDGARSIVEIAGVVTHRQQPETANGTVFLNLEDETGLINVICPPGRQGSAASTIHSTNRGSPP